MKIIKTKQKCHDELDLLVEKLIDIKQLDLALLLVESQFHLIKHSYSAKEKLKKLENLGFSLKNISKSFHYKNNSVKAKQLYYIYDVILNNMQSINDVELKVKTENIACFMDYYGTSCDLMYDFTKSIDIYSKVIFLVKTNFGDDAANFRVYGWCHHNYAVALKETNRLIDAKQIYQEALKIYEQASDWPSEKTKMDSIFLTARMLHEVNTKLQQ